MDIEKIAKINTVAEAKIAYSQQANKDIKQAVLARWIELCSTAKEAAEASEEVFLNSDLEREARIKWDELSLAEVTKTRTIEETMAAWETAPAGGPALKEISLKLDNFFIV